MYGGLFGDLPSAKKQKTAGKDASNDGDDNGDKDNKSRGDDTINTAATTVAKGNWFAPPKQAAAPKAKAKNKSQFLQMVGKSGTTMAFVPTAALKSKRKKIPVVDSSSNNNTNNTTSTEKDDTTKKVPSLTTTNSSTHKQQESSFAAVTTTTIVTTRIAASKPDPTKCIAVVDIHGTGDAIGGGLTDSNKNKNNDGNNNHNNSTTHPTVSSLDAFDDDNNYTEEQPITDPYDPYVPNDLLEYWETLAAKKHREKLERDTREALERQKSMRKQLDHLSGKNNNNNNSGDKNEIDIDNDNDIDGGGETGSVHLIPPMGRGRGRGGLSNLPAWLVEKQRKEQQLGEVGGDVTAAGEQSANIIAPVSFPGRGRGPRGVSNLPAWLVEKQRKEAAAAANGQ